MADNDIRNELVDDDGTPQLNEWEQRQADRAARFRGYAGSARRRSDAAYQGTRDIADQIPLGQPILVGHHSEAGARRDVERINRGMRTAVDEADKAEHYAQRADAIENDRSISQYDPDAVSKLERRIADMEAAQKSDKRVNKALRTGKLDGLSELETSKVAALKAAGPDYAGRHGIPGYVLSNRNSEIRRLKARLAQLQKVAGRAFSMLDRKDFAVAAYYRDEYPTLKEAVLPRVPAWRVANDPRKGEWRGFKHIVLNELSDDELARLTASATGDL